MTGISIAGLAAVLHARTRQPTGSEPRFTNQNITQRFRAALPEITAELNLELATARQIETFTRSDQRTILWGLVDLGTNIVQISVPVTYRYQVPLRDVWKLETRGQQVIVQAPALRVALPPAIHTNELVVLSARGWARSSTAGLQQELERQILPVLTESATDPRRLNLVRDTCRQSVTEFVRLWLERERQWGGTHFNQIQVTFPGEATGGHGGTLGNTVGVIQ